MYQIKEKDIVVYRKKYCRVYGRSGERWYVKTHPNNTLVEVGDGLKVKILIPFDLSGTWGLDPDAPFPFKVGDVVYENPKYPNPFGPMGLGGGPSIVTRLEGKIIWLEHSRAMHWNLTKEKPPTTPAES